MLILVQVIGRGLAVYTLLNQTVLNRELGKSRVGLVIQSVVKEYLKVEVPSKYTRFQAQTGNLQVKSLPIEGQIIHWPRSRVVPVSSKKNISPK
jgi:hypothetical protein